MKLLILSDGHGNTKALEALAPEAAAADAVLFAGDFAAFGKPETGKPFLEHLAKLHDHVFAVAGNCDVPEFTEEMENYDLSVQKSLSYFAGLTLAGSGGGSRFTGTTPNERTDEELTSDLAIVTQSTPEAAQWQNLVVLTHNPPKDTNLDRTDSGAHVGSAGIRKFIEDCQPLLVVSGHIHESRGVDKIGRTRLVNPGALAEGFYAVAEISFSGGTANIEGIRMHSLSLPD